MEKTIDTSKIHNKQSIHNEKGCIHWFSIKAPNPQISSLKVRPFIIIGRTNYKSKRVLISPIQDLDNYLENGKVKYPYHVPLMTSNYGFLSKDSVILLDQVYTINKEELLEDLFIGKIDEFKALDEAIMYNFDLYESMVQGITELLSQYKDFYKESFSRQ